ncbi:MAG TPA: UbiA family prenyltransferase, partial [Elusimicrobiales bacterium]|nr:UbiA family prenyltransferase [Elusimicrobiales bacterium]
MSQINRRAWLELLRPPNLFTVPGDPLAGFFLATAGGGAPAYALAALTAVVALLLYMSGLMGNDVADYSEDLRDRPARPLPSGRVSLRAVRAAACALALAALLLAAVAGRPVFATALLLLLAVTLYNGKFKRFARL